MLLTGDCLQNNRERKKCKLNKTLSPGQQTYYYDTRSTWTHHTHSYILCCTSKSSFLWLSKAVPVRTGRDSTGELQVSTLSRNTWHTLTHRSAPLSSPSPSPGPLRTRSTLACAWHGSVPLTANHEHGPDFYELRAAGRNLHDAVRTRLTPSTRGQLLASFNFLPFGHKRFGLCLSRWLQVSREFPCSRPEIKHALMRSCSTRAVLLFWNGSWLDRRRDLGLTLQITMVTVTQIHLCCRC